MPGNSVAGGWWDAEELHHESRFVASHGDAKPGEELYCISAGWLRKWKRHVERLDHHEDHHRLHINFPHLHLHHHDDHRRSANVVPHPGPITNWDLLDSAWHYDRVKQGLRVGKDYEVVTRAVWNFLQPRYRGGPAISVPARSKDDLRTATVHESQVCDFQAPEMIEDTGALAGQDQSTRNLGSWTSGIDSVSKTMRNMFQQPPVPSCSAGPIASSRRPEEQRALPADVSVAHKAMSSDTLAAAQSTSNCIKFIPMNVVNAAQRRSPLEEYNFVALNDVPQQGQKWHFIEHGWLKQWRNHVVHEGPHPGPICNWKLLGDNMDRPTMKPDLVAGKHYRGVGPAAWSLLHDTYGGGPLITSKIMNIYAVDNFEEDMEGIEEQTESGSDSHDSAQDGDHSPAPQVHHGREGAHSSKSMPRKSRASDSSASTASSVSSTLKALATAPMKRAKALLAVKTFEV